MALTRAAPPVPDTPQARPTIVDAFTGFAAPPAPQSLTWLTAWRWDWLWGTAGVVAALLYLGAVVRLWRRGDRWPIGRTISLAPRLPRLRLGLRAGRPASTAGSPSPGT